MDAKQCRMARVGLDIPGRDLAKTAKVGYATLARFETGSNITEANRAALERALTDAGATFGEAHGRLIVSVPNGKPVGMGVG